MKYEKGSFLTIPNKGHIAELEPYVQTVYIWICNFANDYGECFPSRTTIARLAGCSLKSVDRAIEVLCDKNILLKKSRKDGNKNLTNYYQIQILEGGSVSQSLPSVSQSLGVASEGRTELNPVLTQSTEHGAARIEIVDDTPKKADTAYRSVFRVFSKRPQGWMAHKPQIESAKRLLSAYGLEQVVRAMEFYREHKDDKFMVEIFTPYDLEAKWSKLVKKSKV